MIFRTLTFIALICLIAGSAGGLYAQPKNRDNTLNSYSFDLYRATTIKNENLFLSPLSTYFALGAAYEGAEGKTKKEFEHVLCVKNTSVLKNSYLKNLASGADSCSGLIVSNAIWNDKSFTVKPEFIKAVKGNYFSDFKQTDFAATHRAVSEINEWVSDKTNHRINKIVSGANVSPNTKLLIANAVYFNGEWKEKFEKKNTVEAPFFTSAENQYVVDFMKRTEHLRYFENDAFQFISKPYRDSDLSFCIILPKKLFGIHEIEKKLDNDLFIDILTKASSKWVSLTIPKIQLDGNYELSGVLKDAGLKSAFTGDADFSKISNKKPLQLGQVLHKTWIKLDEEKTEAAAASAATIKIGAGTTAPLKVFTADHPFVFFILENSTDAIIFIGRYVMPVGVVNLIEDKKALDFNFRNRQKQKYSVGDQLVETLYVVNNKILLRDEFETIINQKDIESISVVKDQEEIQKYVKGKNKKKNYDGAIIVKLKKKKDQND